MRASFLSACFASIVVCMAAHSSRGQGQMQIDVQGNAMYSRYNFTDIKNPYNGIDAWMEMKGIFWFDEERSFGLYAGALPVYTSESDFWWQRNVQLYGGVQYYPIRMDDVFWLNGLRLYAWYGWRSYYDEPSDQDAEDTDWRIGADYYQDNLFQDDEPVTALVFMNAGYRNSNFAADDYRAFLWEGNVKLGHGLRVGTYLLPYGVVDWTYSPSHDENWYENFIRAGVGLGWYPLEQLRRDRQYPWLQDLFGHFRVYGEVLYNAAWLGESAPDSVEKTDYRIGISFATGAFAGR